MCGGVKLERGAKAGSAKEKSTVTDTVWSINVTVCHCVGEVWIIGGLALFKAPFGQSGGLNIFLEVKG
jgi:hypothetical protein